MSELSELLKDSWKDEGTASHECLIMRPRSLKKEDRNAQFYFGINEKFHWPKMITGGFLACKMSFDVYFVYKTSACTLIERSSLTSIPSEPSKA